MKTLAVATIAAALALLPLSAGADPNPNAGDHPNFHAYNGHGKHTYSVPEPGTLVLLGAGLLGMALVGRRYFKR